jgi:hypothetical protein
MSALPSGTGENRRCCKPAFSFAWTGRYTVNDVMKHLFAFLTLGLMLSFGLPAGSHDIITTKITYNREIVRIFIERCASCHSDEGSSFSLMTYAEARPWAVAIKEEVLSRRMPPWGAIKGFGEFRNDHGLTGEQIEMITDWVEGGVPEGEIKDLPSEIKVPAFAKGLKAADGFVINGNVTLSRALKVDGILPQRVPDNHSIQLVAELPNGSVEPLLWLYEYKTSYGHPFLFRKPIELPRGTFIRGVPPDSKILLLRPGK